jgi:Na+/H+ antiporter NhaD/arsenite permease-like protein
MTLALSLFLLTYVALLMFSKYKSWIALAMASLFVLLGYTAVDEVLSPLMNWNVFMIIAGTMIVVAPFIASGMPARIADWLMSKVSSTKAAIVILAAFAGIVSAFVDNVATVLIVAPIAFDIAKKMKANPVPLVIAVSVFANIQGFATLVGDTTSVMLASNQYANLNFFEFFFLEGKIGPFFIVQIGTITSLVVFWMILGKRNEPLSIHHQTKVDDFAPTFFLGLILTLLVVASFIPNTPNEINGYITIGTAFLFMIYRLIFQKQKQVIQQAVQAIDFETLALLFGLFVLIIGLENQGVIQLAGQWLETIGNNNIWVIYTLVVIVSVVFSAFIDNIPYVATLLPVMMRVGLTLSLTVPPYLLLFGLLAGATLGGNITPIGASANIAGVGFLKKQGYQVTFKDFFRIGFPITIGALLTGYGLIWFLYR